MRNLILHSWLVLLVACSGAATRQVEPGLDVSLVAGPGQALADGIGTVRCERADQPHRELAIDQALRNAVNKAAMTYGELPAAESHKPYVAGYRLEKYWTDDHQCVASVRAVVDTQSLRKVVSRETRGDLAVAGRPKLALAIASYRIIPGAGVTTKRHTLEPIDALQSEFISRGFDIYGTDRARGRVMTGYAVPFASSKDRDELAADARRDGVDFLVRGELKVTEKGGLRDVDSSGGTYGNQYESVVDGSLEVVELSSNRIVASYVDVAPSTQLSASAASTKAIKTYARAAAFTLAPQMLDSLRYR